MRKNFTLKQGDEQIELHNLQISELFQKTEIYLHKMDWIQGFNSFHAFNRTIIKSTINCEPNQTKYLLII